MFKLQPSAGQSLAPLTLGPTPAGSGRPHYTKGDDPTDTVLASPHTTAEWQPGITGDSQFLPDTAQPGLGVGQLHGQVLLVLAGEAAGGAGGGLGAGRLERAGRLLRLQVVPLLGQVHDQLRWGGGQSHQYSPHGVHAPRPATWPHTSEDKE